MHESQWAALGAGLMLPFPGGRFQPWMKSATRRQRQKYGVPVKARRIFLYDGERIVSGGGLHEASVKNEVCCPLGLCGGDDDHLAVIVQLLQPAGNIGGLILDHDR